MKVTFEEIAKNLSPMDKIDSYGTYREYNEVSVAFFETEEACKGERMSGRVLVLKIRQEDGGTAILSSSCLNSADWKASANAYARALSFCEKLGLS